MRFLFIDGSNNLGGIESFIIETCNYLATIGHETIILAYGKKSIYKNVKLDNKIRIVHYMDNVNIGKDSKKKLKELKKYIDDHINFGDEHTYVITPYFINLQISIYLFSDKENVKIMHMWGEPENWRRTLSRGKSVNEFTDKRIKNRLYYYQRNLLTKLNNCNAEFYGGEVVPIYNSWYYEVDLKYKDIILFPIMNIDSTLVRNENFNYCKSNLKIIWCGRFDYWKNEAIIHIWKTLEEVAEKCNIKFTYDIIGYGDEYNTKYVMSNIIPKNVTVNYLGKQPLDKLSKILSQYDIGIGMGLSIKKMAQVGVPSIVIDSVDKNNIKHLKCQWLFETKMGDAGDGYYYIQAGKEIKGRKYLNDLLEDAIKDPGILREYSKLSKEYVELNYSQERQVQKLINNVKKSKFTGKGINLYRSSLLIRILYRIKKYICN